MASESDQPDFQATLDVTGLVCPQPILKAKIALRDLRNHEILQVIATDPAAQRDFASFTELTAHELVACHEEGGQYYFYLQKGD